MLLICRRKFQPTFANLLLFSLAVNFLIESSLAENIHWRVRELLSIGFYYSLNYLYYEKDFRFCSGICIAFSAILFDVLRRSVCSVLWRALFGCALFQSQAFAESTKILDGFLQSYDDVKQ